MSYNDFKAFINHLDNYLCNLNKETSQKHCDISSQLINIQDGLKKLGGYKYVIRIFHFI